MNPAKSAYLPLMRAKMIIYNHDGDDDDDDDDHHHHHHHHHHDDHDNANENEDGDNVSWYSSIWFGLTGTALGGFDQFQNKNKVEG